MLPGLVAFLLLAVLVVGPLLWRMRQDRRLDNALRVRADVYAALFRALDGDSLVSVHTSTPSLWRPGRIVLSAPADWQWLLEPAWLAVVDRVPPGWELVIKPAPAVAAPLQAPALPRAA